jgi:hypothetical protein
MLHDEDDEPEMEKEDDKVLDDVIHDCCSAADISANIQAYSLPRWSRRHLI